MNSRQTLKTVYALLAAITLTSCASYPHVECEDFAKSAWLSIRILSADYASSSFGESCGLLENTMRQAILSSTANGGGISNAKLLTIEIKAARNGAKSMNVKNFTALAFLDEFCKTWNIRAHVIGYVIVIEN